MGTIKTTNIEPIADNGTVTLGSSGDTFTVPSGVTVAGSMANTPAFFVTASSSQSIGNVSATKVTLDSETYDTDSAFASNKFTVPSGKAGLYAFNWNIRLQSVADGATFITSLFKNGIEVETTRNRDQLGAATDFFHNGAVTLSLAAGDYIEFYIITSGGATTTNQSYVYLSGYKLIGV